MEKKENERKIINKLDNLEKKILNLLNIKLNISLTGNEIKLELSNKNIDNETLNLLSQIEFKNLQEINLSNNNISNIEPITKFKNLKKVNLSYNKIIDVNSLKNIP